MYNTQWLFTKPERPLPIAQNSQGRFPVYFKQFSFLFSCKTAVLHDLQTTFFLRYLLNFWCRLPMCHDCSCWYIIFRYVFPITKFFIITTFVIGYKNLPASYVKTKQANLLIGVFAEFVVHYFYTKMRLSYIVLKKLSFEIIINYFIYIFVYE